MSDRFNTETSGVPCLVVAAPLALWDITWSALLIEQNLGTVELCQANDVIAESHCIALLVSTLLSLVLS